MVVLGGSAVSYERGIHVCPKVGPSDLPRASTGECSPARHTRDLPQTSSTFSQEQPPPHTKGALESPLKGHLAHKKQRPLRYPCKHMRAIASSVTPYPPSGE